MYIFLLKNEDVVKKCNIIANQILKWERVKGGTPTRLPYIKIHKELKPTADGEANKKGQTKMPRKDTRRKKMKKIEYVKK